LVAVDGVPHAWINALVDAREEAAEHVSRLVDAVERNVRIDVAAPEEYRRSVERPRVLARSTWRTDEAAAQADDRRVPAGTPRRELERQTCALREPDQRNAIERYPLAHPLLRQL